MFFKITSITDHIGSAISIPLNGWGSVNVLDYVNFALRYSALIQSFTFRERKQIKIKTNKIQKTRNPGLSSFK